MTHPYPHVVQHIAAQIAAAQRLSGIERTEALLAATRGHDGETIRAAFAASRT